MATLKRKDGKTVVPLSFVDETEEVGQRVVSRVETFLGEWRFDTRAGVDWVGFSTTKNNEDTRIATQLKRAISSTRGVRRVVVTIEDDQTFDVTVYLEDEIEEGGTIGLEIDPKSASPAARV